MFVDQVDIQVAAGDGGRGCLSYRREKFVPRGGPDGGDGGCGGSVYLVASPHLNTLVNYRFHPDFAAARGGHGQGANRTGRNGRNLELEVPVGTVVFEHTAEGPVPLADLTEVGARVLVAAGGIGGHGNAYYASSTNRTPRKTQPGLPGEVKRLRLQLKLLADVGLVGYPNAGKSTLIARVSSARPKIADYPFTTLTPNLGVVRLDEDRGFVIADVPGLIAGAHEGHGLGHRFLSHLERTKVLVHVIDVSSASDREPADDFDVIQRELELFVGTGSHADSAARAFAGHRRLAVANKIDVLDDPSRLERLGQRVADAGIPLYPISAVTGEGVPALLQALWRAVSANDEEDEHP